MADISPPRRRMFEDMTVRKGGKERSATLSTQPLAIPRTYWRLADPGRWLFPERDADRQIEPTTPHAARRSARAAAGIDKKATVRKHRNLLAHAPKHLHDELTEDCRDMIHAATAAEVQTRSKASPRENGA